MIFWFSMFSMRYYQEPFDKQKQSAPSKGRPTVISDDWQPWFAWYPVRVSVIRGRRWRKRWTWLRTVEWTEGHTLGDWLYRLPAGETNHE